MGQADLLVWLEEHPGWHTVAIIAESVGRDASNVRRILGKLRKNGDVECKKADGAMWKSKLYRVNKHVR